MAESLVLTVFLDLQYRGGCSLWRQFCFLCWNEHSVLSYPPIFGLCVLRSQNHTGIEVIMNELIKMEESVTIAEVP